MAWWIYKCNSRNHPDQVVWGDWEEFFASARNGRPSPWGSTRWVPAFEKLSPGDQIIAYQTDRNSIIGTAEVASLKMRGEHLDVLLRPKVHLTSPVRVRPLKKRDERIARIPALQPGPIMTIYTISIEDAELLLSAAGISA